MWNVATVTVFISLAPSHGLGGPMLPEGCSCHTVILLFQASLEKPGAVMEGEVKSSPKSHMRPWDSQVVKERLENVRAHSAVPMKLRQEEPTDTWHCVMPSFLGALQRTARLAGTDTPALTLQKRLCQGGR